MKGMDYAQRLSNLPNVVTSIQRRHERYKILYAYKMKEGFVPNIWKTDGLNFSTRGRCGCVCTVPYYPIRGRAIGVRESSFALTTCNLWNLLPRCIRDINGRNCHTLKRSWIMFYLIIQMYHDAAPLVTLMINIIFTNQTRYVTTTVIEQSDS